MNITTEQEQGHLFIKVLCTFPNNFHLNIYLIYHIFFIKALLEHFRDQQKKWACVAVTKVC